MCEQHDDEHVDEGRYAEGEGETPHVADGEPEQNNRGEEVDTLRGENRAESPFPSGLDRADETLPIAQLVAYALEVDDERVGRESDRDDQARHPGEGESETLTPRQEREHEIGEHPGDDEGCDGDKAEQAVLEQGVDDHENEADDPGDDA